MPSHKKQPITSHIIHNSPSIKTPQKSNSKPHLTAEKYLHAKLQYSENKKISIQRMLESKDRRIIQLEQQISDNQKLVRQTLSKWGQYKKKVEKGNLQEIEMTEERIKKLKEEVERKQRSLTIYEQGKKKIEGQNQQLKLKNKQLLQKYSKLQQKYKQDKREWKQICSSLNSMIKFIQKLPPNILEQYSA